MEQTKPQDKQKTFLPSKKEVKRKERNTNVKIHSLKQDLKDANATHLEDVFFKFSGGSDSYESTNNFSSLTIQQNDLLAPFITNLTKLKKGSGSHRVKAIQNFLDNFLESTLDKPCLLELFIKYSHFYCHFAIYDNEIKIREGLNLGLIPFFKKLNRLIMDHLKVIIPFLWISQFDSSHEVSIAARKALDLIIQGKENLSSEEIEKKTGKLLVYYKTQLIDQFRHFFNLTKNSLEEQILQNTKNLVELEKNDRFIRTIVMSLFGFSTFVVKFPYEEYIKQQFQVELHSFFSKTMMFKFSSGNYNSTIQDAFLESITQILHFSEERQLDIFTNSSQDRNFVHHTLGSILASYLKRKSYKAQAFAPIAIAIFCRMYTEYCQKEFFTNIIINEILAFSRRLEKDYNLFKNGNFCNLVQVVTENISLFSSKIHFVQNLSDSLLSTFYSSSVTFMDSRTVLKIHRQIFFSFFKKNQSSMLEAETNLKNFSSLASEMLWSPVKDYLDACNDSVYQEFSANGLTNTLISTGCFANSSPHSTFLQNLKVEQKTEFISDILSFIKNLNQEGDISLTILEPLLDHTSQHLIHLQSITAFKGSYSKFFPSLTEYVYSCILLLNAIQSLVPRDVNHFNDSQIKNTSRIISRLDTQIIQFVTHLNSIISLFVPPELSTMNKNDLRKMSEAKYTTSPEILTNLTSAINFSFSNHHSHSHASSYDNNEMFNDFSNLASNNFKHLIISNPHFQVFNYFCTSCLHLSTSFQTFNPSLISMLKNKLKIFDQKPNSDHHTDCFETNNSSLNSVQSSNKLDTSPHYSNASETNVPYTFSQDKFPSDHNYENNLLNPHAKPQSDNMTTLSINGICNNNELIFNSSLWYSTGNSLWILPNFNFQVDFNDPSNSQGLEGGQTFRNPFTYLSFYYALIPSLIFKLKSSPPSSSFEDFNEISLFITKTILDIKDFPNSTIFIKQNFFSLFKRLLVTRQDYHSPLLSGLHYLFELVYLLSLNSHINCKSFAKSFSTIIQPAFLSILSYLIQKDLFISDFQVLQIRQIICYLMYIYSYEENHISTSKTYEDSFNYLSSDSSLLLLLKNIKNGKSQNDPFNFNSLSPSHLLDHSYNKSEALLSTFILTSQICIFEIIKRMKGGYTFSDSNLLNNRNPIIELQLTLISLHEITTAPKFISNLSNRALLIAHQWITKLRYLFMRLSYYMMDLHKESDRDRSASRYSYIYFGTKLMSTRCFHFVLHGICNAIGLPTDLNSTLSENTSCLPNIWSEISSILIANPTEFYLDNSNNINISKQTNLDMDPSYKRTNTHSLNSLKVTCEAEDLFSLLLGNIKDLDMSIKYIFDLYCSFPQGEDRMYTDTPTKLQPSYEQAATTLYMIGLINCKILEDTFDNTLIDFIKHHLRSIHLIFSFTSPFLFYALSIKDSSKQFELDLSFKTDTNLDFPNSKHTHRNLSSVSNNSIWDAITPMWQNTNRTTLSYLANCLELLISYLNNPPPCSPPSSITEILTITDMEFFKTFLYTPPLASTSSSEFTTKNNDFTDHYTDQSLLFYHGSKIFREMSIGFMANIYSLIWIFQCTSKMAMYSDKLVLFNKLTKIFSEITFPAFEIYFSKTTNYTANSNTNYEEISDSDTVFTSNSTPMMIITKQAAEIMIDYQFSYCPNYLNQSYTQFPTIFSKFLAKILFEGKMQKCPQFCSELLLICSHQLEKFCSSCSFQSPIFGRCVEAFYNTILQFYTSSCNSRFDIFKQGKHFCFSTSSNLPPNYLLKLFSSLYRLSFYFIGTEEIIYLTQFSHGLSDIYIPIIIDHNQVEFSELTTPYESISLSCTSMLISTISDHGFVLIEEPLYNSMTQPNDFFQNSNRLWLVPSSLLRLLDMPNVILSNSVDDEQDSYIINHQYKHDFSISNTTLSNYISTRELYPSLFLSGISELKEINQASISCEWWSALCKQACLWLPTNPSLSFDAFNDDNFSRRNETLLLVAELFDIACKQYSRCTYMYESEFLDLPYLDIQNINRTTYIFNINSIDGILNLFTSLARCISICQEKSPDFSFYFKPTSFYSIVRILSFLDKFAQNHLALPFINEQIETITNSIKLAFSFINLGSYSHFAIEAVARLTSFKNIEIKSTIFRLLRDITWVFEPMGPMIISEEDTSRTRTLPYLYKRANESDGGSYSKLFEALVKSITPSTSNEHSDSSSTLMLQETNFYLTSDRFLSFPILMASLQLLVGPTLATQLMDIYRLGSLLFYGAFSDIKLEPMSLMLSSYQSFDAKERLSFPSDLSYQQLIYELFDCCAAWLSILPSIRLGLLEVSSSTVSNDKPKHLLYLKHLFSTSPSSLKFNKEINYMICTLYQEKPFDHKSSVRNLHNLKHGLTSTFQNDKDNINSSSVDLAYFQFLERSFKSNLSEDVLSHMFEIPFVELLMELSLFLIKSYNLLDEENTYGFTPTPYIDLSDFLLHANRKNFMNKELKLFENKSFFDTEQFILKTWEENSKNPNCAEIVGEYLFYHLLHTFPAESRRIIMRCPKSSNLKAINSLAKSFVSESMIDEEVHSFLSTHAHANLLAKYEKQYRRLLLEYNESEREIYIKLIVQFPDNYPLRKPKLSFESPRSGKLKAIFTKWQIETSAIINETNLSCGLNLWHDNITQFFQGQDDCTICYFVFHPKFGTLPKHMCPTCKHKFHPECLEKWAETSSNSLCPLCRSPL